MLVHEQRSSGLVVAREGLDETRVSRALKQLNPDFALHFRRDDDELVNVYKVVHVPSGKVVFTWMDEFGRPLPLSSALVDEFQRHMLGSRNPVESADDYNARLVAARDKDAKALSAEVLDEHKARMTRGFVSVALGTSKPRYWKREGARPKSGGSRG